MAERSKIAANCTLTYKQARFCEVYVLNGGNASKAYAEIYGLRGSYHSMATAASALLKKAAVQNYITKLSKKISAAVEDEICKEAKRVLKELSIVSFSDPRKYFKVDDNGRLLVKDLEKMGEEAKAIEHIDITEQTIGEGPVISKRTRLGFHNKVKALETLGKHYELFTDVHKHSGTINMAPEIYLPDNGKGKSDAGNSGSV